LRALGRLDGDQGASILIDALRDERARIAIYALRSIFKSMPEDEVFKLLQDAPTNQITVEKEIIRFIGQFMSPGKSFQYFLAIEKTNLHSDVRITLIKAVWSSFVLPEAQDIFTKAAEDPNPAIAKAVANIPGHVGWSLNHTQALLKLILKLMNHPVAEVRLAALTRLHTDPLMNPNNILRPRLFELILSSLEDESTRAGLVIFKTYARAQHELVAEVFRKSLKNKQVLRRLHSQYLRQASPHFNIEMFPATRLILSVLKDRLTVSLRLRLIFKGLPLDEQKEALIDIIPELHPGALVEAIGTIGSGAWNLDWRWALEMEKVLANKSDERARRLALAYLQASTKRNHRSWTDSQRERLEIYSGDESVLIAEAVAYIFPTLKEDEEK
jgi:hypothetical protein